MPARNHRSLRARAGLGALTALAILLGTLFYGVSPAAAATVPFDLYAVSGTATMPGGQSVTVWGYSQTNAPVTAPAGPTLVVNVGDTVEITLHNQLSETTALLVGGQQMIPDRSGVSSGGTKLYSFTASRPGTYLYEAGLLPNAEHQVAMGLYGALVVRPAATGQAYASPSPAFDDEAVLVLGEIDPALNNRANPATFDMRNYAPRYYLINGKAYPDTAPIATAAGNRVLLRYVNAGIQYHSMALLGAHQTVIALDGSPLALSRRYVADTIGPGQTEDAIVTAPSATGDTKLAVYDGNLLLHNTNAAGMGGMLTFIEVAGGTGGSDTVGPVAQAVAYSGGNLTATVDDTTTGGGTIQAAEYYLDSTAGTGTAMSAVDGTFDTVSEAVTASVTVPAGPHVLYVRGQDDALNWGAFSSVVVNGGDATGPVTRNATLTPSTTNGTVDVAVHATADDSTTGGSNIAAAEYFIDTDPGAGSATPMTVNQPAQIASVDAVIPAATVAALSNATHVVSIRSRDAAGNWGDPVTVSLVVDASGAGPLTSNVVAQPNPNNGLLAFISATGMLRVTATVDAGAYTVTAAEGFTDTVGANGTGFPVAAVDGSFNSPVESVYADIPLTTIRQLADGNHTIYVHGRNAVGAWGPTATTILVVDKTPPSVTGASASPSPTLLASTVTLSASAADPVTGVARAEWFTGADPGVGNATPMTVTGSGPSWALSAPIDVSNWNEGTYTLSIRARDVVGNWSSPVTTTLVVTRPLYFSTAGNSNPPGVGGTADDADIYGWSGSAFSRVIDASAAPYSLPASGGGNANVDGFDRVDATHFYMSFTGNVSVPGIGTVADEDIVYWNGSAWSLWFDGSANGLQGNFDLDAISIVGTTLYFSTDNTSVPPGAGGTGDDADIYRWNGGSSYTRMVDASVAGWSTANVDGLVWVDATRVFLSYSTDTTVPGIGTVQDEDIVRLNGTTWSVYFDGTAHGLTSSNLDIDAFDLP